LFASAGSPWAGILKGNGYVGRPTHCATKSSHIPVTLAAVISRREPSSPDRSPSRSGTKEAGAVTPPPRGGSCDGQAPPCRAASRPDRRSSLGRSSGAARAPCGAALLPASARDRRLAVLLCCLL